ncbi:MAG: YigZ family protein [Propionibacteriaceae bacterium]|jgi:uncharacterized YigZ family protein|nr:YigZ family protein [Propionibacteriaceae bacterium]
MTEPLPEPLAAGPGAAAARPARGWRAEAEAEIRRSRFLALAARADSEAEARELFAAARRRHVGARHYCTAFIVAEGSGAPTSRSSDDGEPAGSAGRPMLAVLAGTGLVNVAAVVARHFGGVKLGVGGLTRAYSGVVQDALADVPRVVPSVRPLWRLRLGHSQAGRLSAELRRRGALVAGEAYEGEAVVLDLAFGPEADVPSLLAQLGCAAAACPAGFQVVEEQLPEIAC